MYRKVLFATLAVVFIVSLCFFVYNQAYAVTITCSASASAGSISASASVSPGATGTHCNSESDCKSKARRYTGSGTAKASVNGTTVRDPKTLVVHLKTEKKEEVDMRRFTVRIKPSLIASLGADKIISSIEISAVEVEVTYEKGVKITTWGLRVETTGASKSKLGLPTHHKWASGNGSIGGDSDSAWDEYHFSGYYN